MSCPDEFAAGSNKETCVGDHSQSHSRSGRLTREQLRRWAALIAKGDTEFPEDLDPNDRELLLGHCRALLRKRLVRLVARTIALDIHRDGGQSRKV
jgi:hypothetical protein